MRILVTGATGFVGSHVVRDLLTHGHDVAVTLRSQTDAWRIRDVIDRLTRIEGDLRDPSAMIDALRSFAPDVLVHLAWEGVFNRDRNDPQQWRNVAVAMQVIGLAKEAGARAWIGLGSQAEYGPRPGRIAESSPRNPTTLYGAAKLATCILAERTCEQLSLRFGWLRLFSSYGPKDHPEWLIPYLMRSLLNRDTPKLTAGEQLWDYIYVADAARAIATVAEQATAMGIFNLGSGTALPLRQLVEGIRDLIDPELRLDFGAIPYRADQVMHLEADVTRLSTMTGWKPQTDLKSGLVATLEWERARHIG